MREVTVLTSEIMRHLFKYCFPVYYSEDSILDIDFLYEKFQDICNEKPHINPTVIGGRILYTFENLEWNISDSENNERVLTSIVEGEALLYRVTKNIHKTPHYFGLYSKNFYDLSQNLVLNLIIKVVLQSFFYGIEKKYSKEEIAEYFLTVSNENMTYKDLLEDPITYIPFAIRYTLLISRKEIWNNDRYFNPTVSTPINECEFNYELNHLPQLEYHLKHWNFLKLISQCDNLYLYDNILSKKKRAKKKSRIEKDLQQFLHQCLLTVRESSMPVPKVDTTLLSALNEFNSKNVETPFIQ